MLVAFLTASALASAPLGPAVADADRGRFSLSAQLSGQAFQLIEKCLSPVLVRLFIKNKQCLVFFQSRSSRVHFVITIAEINRVVTVHCHFDPAGNGEIDRFIRRLEYLFKK